MCSLPDRIVPVLLLPPDDGLPDGDEQHKGGVPSLLVHRPDTEHCLGDTGERELIARALNVQQHDGCSNKYVFVEQLGIHITTKRLMNNEVYVKLV